MKISELFEGKFVEPFLKSGKPNPNHPAYEKNKAAYDKANPRAPKFSAEDRAAAKKAEEELFAKNLSSLYNRLYMTDGWGEIDGTDMITHKIVPYFKKEIAVNPSKFSEKFKDAVAATRGEWGDHGKFYKLLDQAVKDNDGRLKNYHAWEKQQLEAYNELREAVEPSKLEPITVTAKGEDSFIVNTKATKGPTLTQIYWVWKDFDSKRNSSTKSKSGMTLNIDKMLDNKPNGFVITFKNVEGAEEAIKASIEKAGAKVTKELAADAKWKEGAGDRKKEASKIASAKRSEDLKKMAELYGKGTWNRVTYKQEGGDDGYQYVVRVDGKVLCTGQTQSQAMYEKRKAVDAIAKKEKLGKYAEAK